MRPGIHLFSPYAPPLAVPAVVAMTPVSDLLQLPQNERLALAIALVLILRGLPGRHPDPASQDELFR